MPYAVKEIYYTLQGEGAQSGRAAVFCRFAGCNLWSGREADREQAICRFCDTDFVGTDGPNGGKFASPGELAAAVKEQWQAAEGHPLVVCTGGEPLLQLDVALIEAFHRAGFQVAIESNGTLAAPPGIDWVCISPKAGAPLIQTSGDELKLVFPQAAARPEQFANLAFTHFFLQAMDVADPVLRQRHLTDTLAYCLAHPQWRLSLQSHKILQIP